MLQAMKSWVGSGNEATRSKLCRKTVNLPVPKWQVWTTVQASILTIKEQCLSQGLVYRSSVSSQSQKNCRTMNTVMIINLP